MPRGLKTYTACAGPDDARGHEDMGGLVGTLADLWFSSSTAGRWLIAVFGVLGLLTLPLAACVVGPVAIVALVQLKQWYYNERLLCIEEGECAIGTVLSEPTAATDGDRKINLLLAPFSQREVQEALADHLERNRDMLERDANFPAPFHTGGAPSLPSKSELLADPEVFREYMKDLEGDDPADPDASSNMYNQVLVGLVDTLLSDPDDAFFERFFRVDDGAIPDADVRDAIRRLSGDVADYDPTVPWQSPDARSDEELNPLFRFAPTAEEGEKSRGLVPYLHCEVEGNRLEVLINEAITGISTMIAFCVAGPIGVVLGVLAWLLHKLINLITGNDGTPSEPDIEWDDPDFTGHGDVTERTGDVVVVFGRWIMDTEHEQYFEIHPVQAYYIVAENVLADEDTPSLVSTQEEQVVQGPNFDPTAVTAEMASEICGIVKEAEERDPDSTRPVGRREALSHGMTTRY